MQLTRQQILDYLQSNRIATSIELSHALLLTSANIRYHLAKLIDDRFVEVVGLESTRGRGRPKKLYRLTENALKHNLDGLASALLKTVTSFQSVPNENLAKTACFLLGDYQVTTNIRTQLNLTVEKLNQLKYHASWEASHRGPRIIFRNCPFAMILSEHPELCYLDAAILTRMLNRPVEQSAKLERSPDGTPHCTFITSNE